MKQDFRFKCTVLHTSVPSYITYFVSFPEHTSVRQWRCLVITCWTEFSLWGDVFLYFKIKHRIIGGFTMSHNSFSGLFFFLLLLLSVFPWHNSFQQQTNILKQNTLSSNKIFYRNQIGQHSSERDLQGIRKQEFWNPGLARQLFLFLVSLSLLLSPGGSFA